MLTTRFCLWRNDLIKKSFKRFVFFYMQRMLKKSYRKRKPSTRFSTKTRKRCTKKWSVLWAKATKRCLVRFSNRVKRKVTATRPYLNTSPPVLSLPSHLLVLLGSLDTRTSSRLSLPSKLLTCFSFFDHFYDIERHCFFAYSLLYLFVYSKF